MGISMAWLLEIIDAFMDGDAKKPRNTTVHNAGCFQSLCSFIIYLKVYDYDFLINFQDNLFEWHFTIRGPGDSEFDGGVYHGRIVLPPEYPMKPPSIILLTVCYEEYALGFLLFGIFV